MLNKIIIGTLLVISCVLGVILTVQDHYNDELERQIQVKNKIIDSTNKTDSLIVEKTKEYAETIKEYNHETEFTQDGKKVSAAQLVALFNDNLKDIQLLNDSLKQCHDKNNLRLALNFKEYDATLKKYDDSLFVAKWQLELIKKHYGIHYVVTQTPDKKYHAEKERTMVDSAIALFPYYKNKLTFADGVWTIKTDKEYRREEKRLEKLKASKSRN